LLVPNGRYGLGLLGLIALWKMLATGRRVWPLLGGLICGAALMFSQEYGFALGFVFCAGLLIHRSLVSLLTFATGTLLTALPPLLWLAVRGGLGAFLDDLVGYPGYVMAGYANHPFPSITESLPLVDERFTSGSLLLLAYTIPAVCLAGLLSALPVEALDPRRLRTSGREILESFRLDPTRVLVLLTAFYGLISFRTALGRTDLSHVLSVVGAMVVLLAAAASSSWQLMKGDRWLVGAWRLVVVMLVAGLSTLPQVAVPRTWAHFSFLATLLSQKPDSLMRGSEQVNAVADWILASTKPEESVLFLPDTPAFYYLTDRRPPWRFALSALIITDEHRAEALADLQANPPSHIVVDLAGGLGPTALHVQEVPRIDEIPDGLVLGEQITRWISTSYEARHRIGHFVILAALSGESELDEGTTVEEPAAHDDQIAHPSSR
jgi:hypothetical protein